METPALKTTWSDDDFHTVHTAIQKHFQYRKVFLKEGTKLFQLPTIYSLKKFMGLPYTSSGIYAALWAHTNLMVYFESDRVYHYEGFAISEGGTPYAILQDDDENVKYLQL